MATSNKWNLLLERPRRPSNMLSGNGPINRSLINLRIYLAVDFLELNAIGERYCEFPAPVRVPSNKGSLNGNEMSDSGIGFIYYFSIYKITAQEYIKFRIVRKRFPENLGFVVLNWLQMFKLGIFTNTGSFPIYMN